MMERPIPTHPIPHLLASSTPAPTILWASVLNRTEKVAYMTYPFMEGMAQAVQFAVVMANQALFSEKGGWGPGGSGKECVVGEVGLPRLIHRPLIKEPPSPEFVRERL